MATAQPPMPNSSSNPTMPAAMRQPRLFDLGFGGAYGPGMP
jgi:hypothetical protein